MTHHPSSAAPQDSVACQAGTPTWLDAADWTDRPAPLDFRQLRHLTNGALQRLILQVATHPGLQGNPAGRTLAADLERRIHLTAEVSNALFGLTRAPGTLNERLPALCESLVSLLGDADQVIRLTVVVAPGCPAQLEELVLRVAHELVGNAIRHGLYLFLLGHIEVRVDSANGYTTLTVSDDGWGCGKAPIPGEGLSVARLLVAGHGGTVGLQRRDCRTIATLHLPHQARPAA